MELTGFLFYFSRVSVSGRVPTQRELRVSPFPKGTGYLLIYYESRLTGYGRRIKIM